jgi:cytochrome bd-type quinol oxidase subunit 2
LHPNFKEITMKPYVFGIGVMLMLSSAMTGMTWVASKGLRRASDRFGPVCAAAAGAIALSFLIAALAWSAPVPEAA